MAASGTGKSAGQRVLTQRRRNRTLPAVEIPRVEDQAVSRALTSIAEHLRVYEGDVSAPKERFVTMQELEDSGLIESQTKGGYSFISRVLGKDVAQKSGSTANPSLKGTVRKATALGPRTPGGGGGSQNPIEQGKRGLVQKLSDIENVRVAQTAQKDFLMWDGGHWKNFPLFKRDNKWLGLQTFQRGVAMIGRAAGPAAIEDRGYVWVKDGSPTTLWWTDSAGTESQLFTGTSLDDLSDVTITSATTGDLLRYNGSAWVNYADSAYQPAGDYVKFDTLSQTDGYTFLNRTDASNPALYVVQAGAGDVAKFGEGSVGSTTFTNAVTIKQGGSIDLDGDITFRNAEELWFEDSGGTARRVFTLWSDDILYVGETGSVHANSYRGSSHTFDQQVTIAKDSGEFITLKDTQYTSGSTHNAWIQIRDSAGTATGYWGFGSSGNTTMYMSNQITDGDILLSTTGSGADISLDAVDVFSSGNLYVRNQAKSSTKMVIHSEYTEGRLRLYNNSNWGLLLKGEGNDPLIGAYGAGGSLNVVAFGDSTMGTLDTSQGASGYFARFDFGSDRNRFSARNTVVESGGFTCIPDGAWGADAVYHAYTVKGASYSSDSSSVTGYGRIRFHTGSLSDSTMMQMLIKGYNYTSTTGGWCVLVSGYFYAAGNWINIGTHTVYGNPPFGRVAYGESSSYKYILLGTSTTSWAYPKIWVESYCPAYSNQSDYLSYDWDIDISASTPTGWSAYSTLYIGGALRWSNADTQSEGFNLGGDIYISSGGSPSGGNNGDMWLVY